MNQTRVGILAGLSLLAVMIAAVLTTPTTAVPWLYITTGALIFFVLVGVSLEHTDDEDAWFIAMFFAFVFVASCEIVVGFPDTSIWRPMDVIRSLEVGFLIGLGFVSADCVIQLLKQRREVDEASG